MVGSFTGSGGGFHSGLQVLKHPGLNLNSISLRIGSKFAWNTPRL